MNHTNFPKKKGQQMSRYRKMGMYRTPNWEAIGALIGIIVLIVAVIAALPLTYAINGVGSFGPTRTFTATIERLYVDSGSKDTGSSYMVSTDKGVFEVQNGWFLGVYNADEIFGAMKEGKTYQLTTKGKKAVGFFLQEYPYITSATPVDDSLETPK